MTKEKIDELMLEDLDTYEFFEFEFDEEEINLIHEIENGSIQEVRTMQR